MTIMIISGQDKWQGLDLWYQDNYESRTLTKTFGDDVIYYLFVIKTPSCGQQFHNSLI